MIGLREPVPFDPARKHWRQWRAMLRDTAAVYTASARKRWDADGRCVGWRRQCLTVATNREVYIEVDQLD